MEQALKFSGINRVYSDYANNGSCEELINLRVTGGGVETVKSKKGLIGSVPYADIFQHNLGDRTNLIVKVRNNDGTYSFRWISKDGADMMPYALYGPFAGYEEVYYATLGNMVVFSNKTGRQTVTYRFVGSSYVRINETVPNPIITVTPSPLQTELFKPGISLSKDATQEQIVSALLAAVHECEEKNPLHCHGDVLLAFNFKTKDGEEFWTYRWCYVPLDAAGSANQYVQLTAQTKYDGGKEDPVYEVNVTDALMQIAYRTISVTIGSVNIDNSMISAINVYASRPKSALELNSVSVADIADPISVVTSQYEDGDDKKWQFSFYWKGSFYDPVNIYNAKGRGGDTLTGKLRLGASSEKALLDAGILLYLQKTISIDDLKTGVSFNLSFGGDRQMNGKTLPVDAGAKTRYGKMLSYNNRLHYFDSTSRTTAWPPISPAMGYAEEYRLYYTYTDNGVDTTVYAGKYVVGNTNVIIAPSANISTVYTVRDNSYPSYAYAYHMKPSKNYNFSYAFLSEVDYLGSQSYTKAAELLSISSNAYETPETQDVNVTEISNPFVFAVEHSYRIPGIIHSLQPSHLAVSDVQVGQYPLNAFTDRGVFAMEQGSNGVLYSNIFPISSLRSTGETVVTPNGTFFVANRGLYMLSGRQAALVSEALSNGPHAEIRGNGAFNTLVNSDRTYHISNYLSTVPFEQFIEGASLAFDPLRNELTVSNANHPYSYVFNLNTRLWHKITASYSASSNDRYILERLTPTTVNVLDAEYEEEDSRMIHLQTRPQELSKGRFSHIMRSVLQSRAFLDGDENLSFSIFASDNLHDYHCISTITKRNANISQTRLPRAARSYRYYIFVIGGIVDTLTQLNDILMEIDIPTGRIG